MIGRFHQEVTMNIGLLIVAIGLAVVSVPFLLGVGSSFLLRFGTTSNEEQQKVNKVRLCHIMGAFLLCMAVLTFIWSLSGDGFYPWFIGLASAAVVACIVLANLRGKQQ